MHFHLKPIRHLTTWAAVALLAGPVAVTQTRAEAPPFVRVTGITGEAAIVPQSDPGVELLRLLCGYGNNPSFTPTADEVRRAEAGLAAYLRKAAPAPAAVLWQKYDRYRRQYGGVTVGNGKTAQRKLIVNATCQEAGADWLHQVIAVKDGGTCYYQVTFDLANGNFSNLQINGVG